MSRTEIDVPASVYDCVDEGDLSTLKKIVHQMCTLEKEMPKLTFVITRRADCYNITIKGYNNVLPTVVLYEMFDKKLKTVRDAIDSATIPSDGAVLIRINKPTEAGQAAAAAVPYIQTTTKGKGGRRK